jgi:hypothetical protein
LAQFPPTEFCLRVHCTEHGPDGGLWAHSACVLCRQPLGGVASLEVFLSPLSEAARWEAVLGSTVKVGRTPFILRDVAGGRGLGQEGAEADGFWLRGDALIHGRSVQLQNPNTDGPLLLYQRGVEESLQEFCTRVFQGNLALSAGDALETPYSLGPGGTLCRVPGTTLQQLLDGLFAQLATGQPKLCGWTAGPWTSYLQGVCKTELAGKYVAGNNVRATLRTPMARLHPLIPRHEWQVIDSQGFSGGEDFQAESAGELLHKYISCGNACYKHEATTLARLPGEWSRGNAVLPVVETVLLLHASGHNGGWVPSHHLLSGGFPRHSVPRLLRPLRGRFSGWEGECPEGGTLARFRPAEGAVSWAIGRPTASTAEAAYGEMLLAVIHTPGMETSGGEQKPRGLYLSPSEGDLFDIEVSPATWPRATGGRMTEVGTWPPGVAILNAGTIALATRPDATEEAAEVAIASDRVTLAAQVEINKEASTFKKTVKMQSSLEVDS